jgi:thioredoxin reductase
MSLEPPRYDVVIVGGGPAGLQAAMTLGRARRRVLLAAAGLPRNAAASHSHNFFTRDGVPPLELLRLGRDQLATYPTVECVEAEVTDVLRHETGFEVTMGVRRVLARKVLLAAGMRDELPAIPGLAEVWGSSAFFCPYCHGFEFADQPFVIQARGAEGMQFATLVRGWSRDLAIATQGPNAFTPEEAARLKALGIPVHESPIARLETENGAVSAVRLEDGTLLPCRAFLLRPKQSQRVGFPAALGATLTEQGVWKTVDVFGQTEVPGLYAAGDASQVLPAVALAVSTGVLAGTGINGALAIEDADAVVGQPAGAH